MVNQEILEGLRAAMLRGDTLKEAMISFYNSGYKKEEIEEAARNLDLEKIREEIQTFEEEKKSGGIVTKESGDSKKKKKITKKEKRAQKANVQQSLNKKNANEPSSKLQKGQAPNNPPQEVQKQPPEKVQKPVDKKRSKKVKKEKPVKPKKTKQRVSSYGKKSNLAIIVLIILLLFLIGSLVVLFLFKDEIIGLF